MVDSVGFYDSDPEGYSDKTFTADVSDLRARFLKSIPEGGRILDLGCGSGRDSLVFSKMGYAVVPVDGSEGMCRIAHENTGLEVRHLMFSDLDYEDEFDGVWACSTLLHVPSSEIRSVLLSINRALYSNGILYMSFKQGDFEGERDGRYYNDVMPEGIGPMISGTGFRTMDVWTSMEPARDIEWTNAILVKDGCTDRP